MKRISFDWSETVVEEDWKQYWFTDFTMKWFPVNEWRFCIAKYDGFPYFLLIVGFIMFRFGKAGYYDESN